MAAAPSNGSNNSPAEALAFLQALGKDPAATYFRTIRQPAGTGINRGRQGRDLKGFDLAELQRNNERDSIYAVIGNATGATGVRKTTGEPTGCVRDEDIATCPALFVEHDDRPIQWQIDAWKEKGFPQPSLQTSTGGASIHSYWLLAEPLPRVQWRQIQEALIDHFEGDTQCKNPARVMRVPGFRYFNKKTGKPTGTHAELILDTGKRYSLEELLACLPTGEKEQPPEPQPRPRTSTSTGSFPARSLEEIRAAAEFIPARISGQPESSPHHYTKCRDALCGCAAALAEIGLPEAMALDLLGHKWPTREAAAQVLDSTTTRNAGSFWGIAGQQGYNLSRTTGKVVPISAKRAQRGGASSQAVLASDSHGADPTHGQQPTHPAARVRQAAGGKRPALPGPDHRPVSSEATESLEYLSRPLSSEGTGELQLKSKESDWLPMALKLAFGADRWLHIEGILHRWTGTHYEPLPDQTLAPRVAPVLSRLFYINNSGEIIHHWARPARVVEAIEWFRKNLPPCKDFNPSNALNCRNGPISWGWEGARMKITFAPHDPAQRFTYCLPYDYNPEADGEHLWRLLDALEPHDRDTMQRLLGAGLQLERYRASKGRIRALLLLGDGENGKDTIRGALSLTLGARGVTGCTLSDFQQYDKGRKFPIAPLRGARINWSPENTSFARLEAIQSLKGAITGETLSWEQKNVQEEEFTPNAIFLFNCNQPPLMDAGQAAMQSRWHAIRFLKRYSSNPDLSDPNQLQADPRLKDDLGFIRENICPAMLNWLLGGLQLAVRDGINFRSNPETIDAIRRQSCHLFDFAEDVGLVDERTAEIEHRKVWELLEHWYQEQKILQIDHGRRTWNDREMRSDPPVRTPRLLEGRLKAVFPKLSSRKVPKSRFTMLQGIALA